VVRLGQLRLEFCNLSLFLIVGYIVIVVVLGHRWQGFLRSVRLQQLLIVVDECVAFSAEL